MAKITAVEFANQLEELIDHARTDGLSDKVIIAGLEEAAEALDEGLPSKLSAAEFKMLQRIPDVGLTKTGLRRLFPGLAIDAQLRTLRALIQLHLVVETQSEDGEVRFDLTDAGRRLAR